MDTERATPEGVASSEGLGRTLAERAEAARNFPTNTCSASRHAQDIGEAMMRGEFLPDNEDMPYAGESILAAVVALYEARTERDKLRVVLKSIAQMDMEGAIFAARGHDLALGLAMEGVHAALAVSP